MLTQALTKLDQEVLPQDAVGPDGAAWLQRTFAPPSAEDRSQKMDAHSAFSTSAWCSDSGVTTAQDTLPLASVEATWSAHLL